MNAQVRELLRRHEGVGPLDDPGHVLVWAAYEDGALKLKLRNGTWLACRSLTRAEIRLAWRMVVANMGKLITLELLAFLRRPVSA